MEIGVLDGTASPGSAAEKAQVRSFVNEFSAGCLTRARAKMAVAGRGPPVDMLEMESKLNELAGPGALINVAAGLDKMQVRTALEQRRCVHWNVEAHLKRLLPAAGARAGVASCAHLGP